MSQDKRNPSPGDPVPTGEPVRALTVTELTATERDALENLGGQFFLGVRGALKRLSILGFALVRTSALELTQPEQDVTKIAGWCALCEEPKILRADLTDVARLKSMRGIGYDRVHKIVDKAVYESEALEDVIRAWPR